MDFVLSLFAEDALGEKLGDIFTLDGTADGNVLS